MLQTTLAACEKASADDQALGINRAFEIVSWRCQLLASVITWNPDWLHLQKLLDLGAFEQAGLMLLPTGATWRITRNLQSSTAIVDHAGTRHGATAATPALAMAAAALQLKAAL